MPGSPPATALVMIRAARLQSALLGAVDLDDHAILNDDCHRSISQVLQRRANLVQSEISVRLSIRRKRKMMLGCWFGHVSSSAAHDELLFKRAVASNFVLG